MRRVFLVGLLILLTASPTAFGRTWRVPSECPTLKAGCDSASYGDTVLVEPGIYPRNTDPETWWLLKPGLAMVSEAGPEVTIIEICEITVGVGIVDEGVRFSGFTVRYGSGPDCEVPPTERLGICCTSTDAVVEDCIIEHFDSGISMDEASLSWYKPLFRNNVIHNCGYGISLRGLLDPGRPYIEGNVITECHTGVHVIDSSPMLADNIITDHRCDGLYYGGHCGGNCERNVIANNASAGVFIFAADPPLAVPDFNGGLVPADANDFYGNGTYDIDYPYSDRGGVMAKWNWWGSDCPDFAGKVRGLVYYEPWTDSTHTQRLDEDACNDATGASTWSQIKALFREGAR
jgi:hypothetical protein